MSDDRRTVEDLLGTAADPGWPLLVSTWSAPGDLDLTVTYASLEMPREAAERVVDTSGFRTPEAMAYATVLLPGGWSVDPAHPPRWWTPDPAALDDQAARPLEPNGWLVCGYGDGRLWLLATRSAEPEP